MKTTIFLLLMIILNSAYNQSAETYSEFFASEFVTETNGYIFGRDKTESINACFVQTPSFYNFDLVRMSSRNIVNKYNDVKVVVGWERDDKNLDKFTEIWLTDDQFYVIISYIKDKNFIIVSVAKANAQ